MHSSSRPSDQAVIPSWKRSLDLTSCLLALPLLGGAALLVGCWLAVISPGPVLFRQERVGLQGRRFLLYKFRTMQANADTGSHQTHMAALLRTNGPMQKLDTGRDARVVPGGWLLRASGLDELPQILNVLRGDMSLVGPRPCLPYEYEQYSTRQRARLNSMPGLTGLWQVSGKNRTTFEEMVRFDIEYGQVKSLWLDLFIIAKTIPALAIQVVDTRLGRQTRTPAPAALPSHHLSNPS